MNASQQKFNDDLLLGSRDRDLAASTFQDILHVLDFPELRELFSTYDVPSRRAKRHRRILGFIAIILGVASLLGASVALLFDKKPLPWPEHLAEASALMGMLSVLIGSVGALAGPSKRHWLCGRLMTERLRQFHFQTMVCRLPEILASTRDPESRKRFLDERRALLADYRLAYEAHLPARLRVVLDDDADEDFWLHPQRNRGTRFDSSNGTLAAVFSAYRLLRFEHQIQYASYRLRPDEAIFSNSASRQLEILRNVALFFILVIFFSNLGLAGLLTFADWTAASTPAHLLHTGIIGLFVLVLATRTLEEGLQPAREVERYTRYRSSTVSLLRRFDAATDPQEKVEIMAEVERASYQEMRGFLRTHNEARYVL